MPYSGLTSFDCPLRRFASRHGKDMKLILSAENGTKTKRDQTLVSLITEAHAAHNAVLASPAMSVRAVATQLGQCSSRAAHLMRIVGSGNHRGDQQVRHPPRHASQVADGRAAGLLDRAAQDPRDFITRRQGSEEERGPGNRAYVIRTDRRSGCGE